MCQGMKKPGFLEILNKKYRELCNGGYLPAILLFLICCSAYLLRILPAFTISGDLLDGIESVDSLYQLRQVEVMVHNFPRYPFFDPMTFFPYGYLVNWGPLYGYILTLACILTGAATRPEIARTVVFVPPLLAVLIIPLAYCIGKRIHSTWCGIIAAAILAVIPGSFFFISYFGVIDHHIAEVLFGTAFCLAYMTALHMITQENVHHATATQQAFIILSVLAGCAYLLGFLNMPTMIIFALIVALYTFLQYLQNFRKGIENKSLVILNLIVFGIAAAGSFLAMQEPRTFLLTMYSLGHPVMYLMIIAGTAFLYLFGRFLHGRSFRKYILILSGLIGGFLICIVVLSTHLFFTAMNGISEIFGQKELAVTIVETQKVGFEGLLDMYSFGLILFFAGIGLLAYRTYRDTKPEFLFFLTWVGIIFIAAYQHLRYNYLLAVPFALASGFFVISVIEYGRREFMSFINWISPKKLEMPGGKRPQENRKGKKTIRKEKGTDEWREIAVGCTILLCAAFIINSAWMDVGRQHVSVPAGWRSTMDWVDHNTSDPGIGYTAIYDVDDFSYPPQAYGVMSWWDYGHLITFFGKRIPNSNPFQAGVRGKHGAAAFFMGENEGEAKEVLEALGTRYVVTDAKMATSKFWAMATWDDTLNATSPYIIRMNTPIDPARRTYQSFQFLTPSYHRTLVARLHLFDGSEKIPRDVVYIEYEPGSGEGAIPRIRFVENISWDSLQARINERITGMDPSLRAMVGTRNYMEPATAIPALCHFRLIYESPENAILPEGYDITQELKQVKVFEYVPGARIKGSGQIRIDLETNTGRRFSYIQESIDGEFVVPYATGMPNGAVKTLGPYRIPAENRSIQVSESDIQAGAAVT